MKVKVYLNDWSINAGIIGFIKILEHSEKGNIVTKMQNYIEFDTSNLRDFHICYFKYFFDKYNIANKVNDKMEKDFEILKNYLKEENQDAKTKQKYKTRKEYLKNTINPNLEKIKKIDKDLYEEMNSSFKQLELIKEYEDSEKFDEIYEELSKGFLRDDINKRITMNAFKSYLSNNFFGQNSFLNVVCSSLSFEQQEELMYRDYISNIIEIGFLQEILDDKYNLEQIKEYIEKINKNTISKNIDKIYTKLIKNYIEKGKDINDVKDYIKESLSTTCHVCEQSQFLTNTYTEGLFLPLAVSSENAQNFFWNMEVDYPICDICKLMLFCAPAGISQIIKVEKDVSEYKEKSILCFVNYDTDIDTLKLVNENLARNSKKEYAEYNPYSDLVLDIVKQEKKISTWQLQNIFVIELDAEYRGFSRLQYFNIQKPVAIFLQEYNVLEKIKDYKYRLQLMEYILNNKDFSQVINSRLYDEIKKEESKRFGINSFLATRARLTLKILKREEELNMQKELIEKNNKKISVLYNLGVDIHENLKNKNEENKIDGYVYQLLNSIKVGDKDTFMDIVIRLHIAVGKDISPIFLDSMKEGVLDFEDIGHSFVSGLISNRYEKQPETENNKEDIRKESDGNE